MCGRRERGERGEIGLDYSPGNKYGLSTSGVELISGVAAACGLVDVSGSALFLWCVCVCVCVCVRVRERERKRKRKRSVQILSFPQHGAVMLQGPFSELD